MIVNKLNEFADNTFTFGESILKKMEEAGFNDKFKVTADVISKKSEDFMIANSGIFKRTKDTISQTINPKVFMLKDKATDKLSALGGRLWGVKLILNFKNVL